MKRELIAILLGMMTNLVAPEGQDSASRPADAAASAAEKRAAELFVLLPEKRFDQFAAAGEEAFQKALSGDKLAQGWAGIALQLGAFKQIDSSVVTRAGAHHSVRITAAFERGKLITRLVLNAENKLSGWWVDAIDTSSAAYKPPAYVDPASYVEKELPIECDGLKLGATLTLPRKPGPHPAAILVHGSGPHDRDETIGGHRPFRDLALGLASRGVAVLRYEKRTKAHPTFVAPDAWTLDDEVIDDAVAGAKLLRAQPEIDARRVFVLGHSLGAMLAPSIAVRDGELAGIALLAGTPRSILDVLQEQFTRLAGFDGGISADERKQLDGLREQIATIRAGTHTPGSAVAGMPAEYLRRLHDCGVNDAVKRLSLPILVLQGGRDYQITRTDYEAWRELLTASGYSPDGKTRRVTLRYYDDLNHLFVAGSEPSTPAEYAKSGQVDERVIRDLAEWIAAVH